MLWINANKSAKYFCNKGKCRALYSEREIKLPHVKANNDYCGLQNKAISFQDVQIGMFLSKILR